MSDSRSEFMHRLRLVLVRTRFPENIGTAARASANFGHSPLYLVRPERWTREKALPLATSQGAPLLDTLTVCDDLAEAVAPCSLVVGTTARTGGWRRQLSTPRQAAAEVAARLAAGEQVALVFGPEDRGLSKAHLAQAVLLLVYECRLALPGAPRLDDHGALSRRVTREERDLLDATLKRSLMDIGFLRPDNPDYFFLPLARFLDRADVRRHEMDLLMGICRRMARRAASSSVDPASARPAAGAGPEN